MRHLKLLVLKIKIIWYTIQMWLESFEEESIEDIKDVVDGNTQYYRNYSRLLSGIKKIIKAQRASKDHLKGKELTECVTGYKKTLMESMEEARIRAKLLRNHKEENEKGMSETFVKNQERYKLEQIRRQKTKELGLLIRQISKGDSRPETNDKSIELAHEVKDMTREIDKLKRIS